MIFLEKSLEFLFALDDSTDKQDMRPRPELALFFGIFGKGFNPAMLVIINKVLEP